MAYGQQAILPRRRRQPSNLVGRQTRVIQLDGSSFNSKHSALHSTYRENATNTLQKLMYNSFKISFRTSTTSGTRANNVPTRLGCLYTRPLQRKGGPWVNNDSGLNVPLLKKKPPPTIWFKSRIRAFKRMTKGEVIFFYLGVRWDGWWTPRPVRSTSRERHPVTHCTGCWVGPQRRSGRVRKDSPSSGITNPRTVQPVASRYTDWAIPINLKHIMSTLMRWTPG